MPLSQEDITGCRVAFNNFDKDGSGTVRVGRGFRVECSFVDPDLSLSGVFPEIFCWN